LFLTIALADLMSRSASATATAAAAAAPQGTRARRRKSLDDEVTERYKYGLMACSHLKAPTPLERAMAMSDLLETARFMATLSTVQTDATVLGLLSRIDMNGPSAVDVCAVIERAYHVHVAVLQQQDAQRKAERAARKASRATLRRLQYEEQVWRWAESQVQREFAGLVQPLPRADKRALIQQKFGEYMAQHPYQS
jgi:hypothetical protein